MIENVPSPAPLVVIFFYFFPTLIALLRRHKHFWALFLFNLFLGFGWGMFAAWYFAISCKKPGLKSWVIFFILNAIMITIALPEMLSKRRYVNDTTAKENLTRLYHALENPQAVDELKQASKICGQTASGFIYDCAITQEGYRVTATPVSKDKGNIKFTLETGGLLNEDGLPDYMQDKTYRLE